MVSSGHLEGEANDDTLPVGYQNRRRPGFQLDVVRLSNLFTRVPGRNWARPERPDFHIWVWLQTGCCRPMIDFEHYVLASGALMHVRPGQVLGWDRRPETEGIVVLMTPLLVSPAYSRNETLFGRLVDAPCGPAIRTAPLEHQASVGTWFERLVEQYEVLDDHAAARELLQHLAAVALLDVLRADGAAVVPKQDPRMAELDVALERSFRVTRAVGDYAAALGVSAKTLDRMTQRTAGMSAKRWIDARVLLEGKRMLAHGDATLESIGEALGFSEATNFAKFFRAHTGKTPGAFRRMFR